MLSKELEVLGVTNQDLNTFPLSKIKSLTVSEHFKKRASQRFGIDSSQALAWAKHLLKSAEYAGTNSAHKCQQYRYKQVIIVVDMETSTLVTVMSNIYEKVLKDDNLNVLAGIESLPNQISKAVISSLYKATNAYLRNSLSKVSLDALSLSKSMQVASKTSQPQVLNSKYQAILKEAHQLVDTLGSLNKLNNFGGLSSDQIKYKAKFYHTISSNNFKVSDEHD